MTRKFCDRCGKDCTSDSWTLKYSTGKCEQMIDLSVVCLTADLCEECTHSFRFFMTGGAMTGEKLK